MVGAAVRLHTVRVVQAAVVVDRPVDDGVKVLLEHCAERADAGTVAAARVQSERELVAGP